MKRFSKIAPLLSGLLLVSTLCQPIRPLGLTLTFSSHATAADLSSGSGTVQTPAADPLVAALYDCIDKGEPVLVYESPVRLAEDSLKALIYSMYEDYPAFFYLDYISLSYRTERNADGSLRAYVYEFKPIYALPTKEAIAAAKAEWETMLADILKIVTPGMTDLEKALALHDYLCMHFSYDASLTVSDSYTFLKRKTGVCEAYADTYSALLTRLNIPNLFAFSEEMNHVWNVIKLDGQWYHIDITHDDPLNEQMQDQPGKALHTAFLRSDSGMTELGYTNWVCDVACTSTKYDGSVFSEIISALTGDGSHYYGVSYDQNAILRLDLTAMTAEPIVDLSDHHWYVWGETAYWNACFVNLYCDGEWLYYSTPLGIEAYDLASGGIMTICTYDKGDGYLYAMRYENHHLICTVSTLPAAAEGEFIFQTRHRYGEATADGIFLSSKCIECEEQEYRVAPTEGNAFAVVASARPTPEAAGFHDIRVLMAVDWDRAATLGQLEYTFTLDRSDGSTDTLVFHSENDIFDEFTRYDSFTAGGKVYKGANDHALIGFYVSALADASWTKLRFTVKSAVDQTVLHDAALEYAQLVTTAA